MRKIIVIGMMLLAIVLVAGCGHKEPLSVIEPQVDLGLCENLSHGDSYLAPDGCNTCTCNFKDDGTFIGAFCTEIGCMDCTNLEDCYNIQYTGEELKEAWNNLSDGYYDRGVIWVFFSDFEGLDFEGFEYFIFEDAGFVELIIHENELNNVILLNEEENFEGFFMNYIIEEDEIDIDHPCSNQREDHMYVDGNYTCTCSFSDDGEIQTLCFESGGDCPEGYRLVNGTCEMMDEGICDYGCPDGEFCVGNQGCVKPGTCEYAMGLVIIYDDYLEGIIGVSFDEGISQEDASAILDEFDLEYRFMVNRVVAYIEVPVGEEVDWICTLTEQEGISYAELDFEIYNDEDIEYEE